MKKITILFSMMIGLSILTICMTGQASESIGVTKTVSDYLFESEYVIRDCDTLIRNKDNYLVEAKPIERCYCYQKLDKYGQRIYEEILSILLSYEKNVLLSCKDENEIGQIFECVMNDHPELFYVDTYEYAKYMVGSKITRITFSGNYNRTVDEIREDSLKIEQQVALYLEQITPAMDEYEIVKYFYESIIQNTSYSGRVEDSQNMASVFLDKESVCKGYACAFQYLLDQTGITGCIVTGSVSNGLHAWNLVEIDKAFYYVDTTWGDVNYRTDDSQGEKRELPEIDYDYLCITTDELLKTHSMDVIVDLPVCSAKAANYYVREQLCFYSFDRMRLQEIISQAEDEQQSYIAIKCSNSDVYKKMYQELIENQQIFEYLSYPKQSISHVENDDMRSICIWL